MYRKLTVIKTEEVVFLEIVCVYKQVGSLAVIAVTEMGIIVISRVCVESIHGVLYLFVSKAISKPRCPIMGSVVNNVPTVNACTVAA